MSDILEKNNYLVKVQRKQTGPNLNSFQVNYPSRTLFVKDDNGMTDSYELSDNSFVHISSSKTIEEKITLPEHLRRLVILADIYQTCRRKNINTELIKYFNEEGQSVKSFWKLTENIPLSDQSKKKEKILKEALDELINKGVVSQEVVNQINENNLHHSINLLTGYLL